MSRAIVLGNARSTIQAVQAQLPRALRRGQGAEGLRFCVARETGRLLSAAGSGASSPGCSAQRTAHFSRESENARGLETDALAVIRKP